MSIYPGEADGYDIDIDYEDCVDEPDEVIMTRKDALTQLAHETTERLLAETVCLSDGECRIVDRVIAEVLQQVEREVLGRVANRCIHTIGTRIQYQDALSPWMQELAKVRNEELQALVDWLATQQKELG